MKRFASIIKDNVRCDDLACRYGGEEFLIMIQSNQMNNAKDIALRIMARLEDEKFKEYPDFRFTVSVGIASGTPCNEDTLENYINNADNALYEAKNNGRNTIFYYN